MRFGPMIYQVHRKKTNSSLCFLLYCSMPCFLALFFYFVKLFKCVEVIRSFVNEVKTSYLNQNTDFIYRAGLRKLGARAKKIWGHQFKKKLLLIFKNSQILHVTSLSSKTLMKFEFCFVTFRLNGSL